MRTKTPKCPEGHKLPNMIEGGAQCTELVCAVRNAAIAKLDASLEVKEVLDDEGKAMAKAERAVQLSVAREKLRKRLIPRPTMADSKEAEEWSDQRLTQLLPEAVAELEYNLRFGDDSQRERAAQRILDATGRSRKELSASGGQTIILNVSGGLPWQGKVVNAEVSAGKAGGGQAAEVREHIPAELRGPSRPDFGRGPAAEGAGDQPDSVSLHPGSDPD